jgi:hypothetical protein
VKSTLRYFCVEKECVFLVLRGEMEESVIAGMIAGRGLGNLCSEYIGLS